MKNTRMLIVNIRKIIRYLVLLAFIVSLLCSLALNKQDILEKHLTVKSADIEFLGKNLPILMHKRNTEIRIRITELFSILLNENLMQPVNIFSRNIFFISTVQKKMSEYFGYSDESNNYYIPKIIEKYFGEAGEGKKYKKATERTVVSVHTGAGETGKHGITLDNKTKYQVNLEKIYNSPLKIDKKSVLIVHTHGSEGYNPDDRSENLNENVIRIGREMKNIFEENGIKVYHSEKMHDIPKFNNSYRNSLATVNEMMEKHPDIGVVLDIHRDAMISASGEVFKVVCEDNDVKNAQVMFVVGTNEGGLSHDKWRENLNFAVKCQEKINGLMPNLARPINLRSERFNQHTTGCSVIIEVGTNGNTLEEAIRAAKMTARAISDVIKSH
ncbi:MAG: hypothetical protein E7411_03860 [Ruminococcaceae bacterium]|nr:hypothetical protein [Oscillospiraceae bacterium]